VKARADANRKLSERIADVMTAAFGSMPFLLVNGVWFLAWIVINLGLIPGIEPFDPFPFGLLTMIVSLEAIMLAIVVLISQNRAAKIADLREEVDLEVDVITERELTKLLELLVTLMRQQGIDLSRDAELRAMLRPTDAKEIEATLEEQVVKEN